MVDSPLDDSQYSAESIDHYEAIFGRDFISPGGEAMARELLRSMNLSPGFRVLDVGCGIGGAAFLMAEEFGCRVDGIDLSANMISRARERRTERGLEAGIGLRHGDCLQLTDSDCYDAVYSRDVFLHIGDKGRLFKVLRRALKAGGILLFTDYCCGPPPWHPDFSSYVGKRGYRLHTVGQYAAIIERAGFRNVRALDWSDRFIDLLEEELSRIPGLGLKEADTLELQRSWQDKIRRARTGDHRWGMFTATA
jgi:phosphoethanolamine N-methyltransferase